MTNTPQQSTRGQKAHGEEPKEVKELKQRKDQFEKMIRQAEKYVRKRSDGMLELDEKGITSLKLDAAMLEGMKNGMRETNLRIKAGELRSEDVRTTYDPSPPPTQTRGAAGGGVTAVRYNWWGIELFLKDSDTHALLDAIKAGAPAVAVLLTAFLGPVGAAAFGAIFILGGVVINLMDNWGEHDGVIFGHLWHPFIPPWVWYQ